MSLKKQTIWLILFIVLVCVAVAALILLRAHVLRGELIPINDTPPDMLPSRFPIYL